MDPSKLRKFKNWVPVVPIDHEPVPPGIKERLKLAYRIVTYSPFGERELKDHGMHSTYIPHTVDTKLFKKHEKTDIRGKIGIPDDVPWLRNVRGI